MIYLIDGHPDFDRIEAADWASAEAALKGVGVVLGELSDDVESKSAAYAGFTLTELKFSDGGTEEKTFSGYGAVFNNVDLGGDKILPGAFGETLAGYKAAGRMPAMFYQHGQQGGGPVMPVGVWKAMEEDRYGLRVEGKLSETTLGNDLYRLMKDGAIGGLSIGYRVKESARGGYNSEERRVIKSAQLIEVSLVNDPMNPEARVSAVKTAGHIKTEREFEDALREGRRFSNSQAKAIASLAKGVFVAERDAGKDADALAELLRRNINILKG